MNTNGLKTAAPGAAHNIEIYDRERVELSGVSDVVSFDENNIQLSTTRGELSIDGSELHITRLDTGSGEVSISGKIDAVNYYDEEKRQKTGVFAKFLK